MVLAATLAYVLTPLVNRLQPRLQDSRGAAITVISLPLALFISGAALTGVLGAVLAAPFIVSQSVLGRYILRPPGGRRAFPG